MHKQRMKRWVKMYDVTTCHLTNSLENLERFIWLQSTFYSQLLKRVSELTTKNQELELIVDQAKYFASMLHVSQSVDNKNKPLLSKCVVLYFDRSMCEFYSLL